MKTKFSVTGLDCPNCAAKLEGLIGKVKGIDSAKINFLSEKLTVESDLPAGDLLAAIREAAKAFPDKVTIDAL
ncbi:MAG: heavy-metal-associated domain-containing protein [Clostridia bacterium]|nr:heavy-metal-associated domain-containing protein [Clostridia bacterium]